MTQDLPPTAADTADTSPLLSPEMVSADEFDEIDAILDELRTRDDETPQWEFCEGFMAALVCCRRPIPPEEYLPVLLAIDDDDAESTASFADVAQQERFVALWTRRWNEVVTALDTPIEALDDEAAYQPEVMDVRGAILALPEEERAAMEGEEVPSFGQVWALGFMFAVEAWPEEWTAPRNKEAVKWLNAALDVIVTLTEDDTDPPTMSAFDDGEGPPTLSLKRMNDFADAIWAVYNLREMWQSIGPRVETVHKVATPGRNDPCSCGSGKKYKKCCGA
jgi:uncharacterized protein